MNAIIRHKQHIFYHLFAHTVVGSQEISSHGGLPFLFTTATKIAIANRDGKSNVRNKSLY